MHFCYLACMLNSRGVCIVSINTMVNLCQRKHAQSFSSLTLAEPQNNSINLMMCSLKSHPIFSPFPSDVSTLLCTSLKLPSRWLGLLAHTSKVPVAPVHLDTQTGKYLDESLLQYKRTNLPFRPYNDTKPKK